MKIQLLHTVFVSAWVVLVMVLLFGGNVSFGFLCNQFEQGSYSWKPSARLKHSQQTLFMIHPNMLLDSQRNLFRIIFKQLDKTCTENSAKSLISNHGDEFTTNTLFIQSVYEKLKKKINTPHLKQFFLGPPIAEIKGNRYKGNPASWMYDLRGIIGDYPLNRLVIPGTHASFSNHLNDYSRISPDGKRNEHFIFKTLKYYPKDVLNRVQSNWSKTQSRSALLQLRDGIRYFDIRICRDRTTFKKITMLKSCNTMFDRPIEESLNEIVQFIQEFPHEIVILDFAHFFEMSEYDHNYLSKVLKKKFGNLLANSKTIQPSSSLNEIWKQTKQRVIVIYNEEQIVKKSNGLFWSPSHSSNGLTNIQYIRPIVRNTHDLFMSLSKEIASRKIQDQSFFAIQCKITPDNFMIANGIIGRPSSALELGHFFNPEIVNWLSTQAFARKQVNIIMLDNYSDSKDIVNVILQQNTIKI